MLILFDLSLKKISGSIIGETSKVCNIDILFLIHPVWYDFKLYAVVHRGNIFILSYFIFSYVNVSKIKNLT